MPIIFIWSIPGRLHAAEKMVTTLRLPYPLLVYLWFRNIIPRTVGIYLKGLTHCRYMLIGIKANSTQTMTVKP